MSINFPNIDPVLIYIGPLPIRWYSIAYMAGILLGIFYINFLAKKSKFTLAKNFIDDFLLFAVFGIIIGGRLGHVFLYDPTKYLMNPIEILYTWEGGMSFHGGFVGFVIATALFARSNKLNPWKILDLAACAAPIGIFFGRLANFVNAELVGRVTNKPWGVVFPNSGILARHPSQIYEALSEGLLLFLILNILFFKYHLFKKDRMLSGAFCILYSVFRLASECFREPDQSIGFIFEYFTMGQVISCITIIFGIIVIKKDILKKTL